MSGPGERGSGSGLASLSPPVFVVAVFLYVGTLVFTLVGYFTYQSDDWAKAYLWAVIVLGLVLRLLAPPPTARPAPVYQQDSPVPVYPQQRRGRHRFDTSRGRSV
jgi:hypothetical protein